MLSDCRNINNTSCSDLSPISNKDIAIWIRFLKQQQLPIMFANLTDCRQQLKTTYTGTSLALWAFSVYAFRQGSKNALNTTLDNLKKNDRASMEAFLGTKNSQLPTSSTVDDYLRHVSIEELNEILLKLFENAHKNKLFYNHAETLLPDNDYLIGTDGFHTHTYTSAHSVDDQGCNNCPYCLPRRRNAGTPEEKIYWVHIFMTFVIIFPTGLKIPIYIYPLKAQQVNSNQAEESFKQECELTAAHAVLPLVKKRFPRMKFTFCGDGLYANEPFIKLCELLYFNYLIVRKEKCLKSLSKHCDELENSELYQKSYTHKDSLIREKIKVNRRACWFNNEALGKDSFTNVLRFEEFYECSDGIVNMIYKGEWLCGKPLKKTTCLATAKKARLRWEQEDLHNTCKNRGFEAKHDMARADPNLCAAWKIMLFIAFSVFELFRCTVLAQEACKKRSWMKFAKDLLQQLVEVPWRVIYNSPILQKGKMQFRYNFSHPP